MGTVTTTSLVSFSTCFLPKSLYSKTHFQFQSQLLRRPNSLLQFRNISLNRNKSSDCVRIKASSSSSSMAAENKNKNKNVQVFDSEEDLAVSLAKYTADLSAKFGKEKGSFTVVLSGGSLIDSLRWVLKSIIIFFINFCFFHDIFFPVTVLWLGTMQEISGTPVCRFN